MRVEFADFCGFQKSGKDVQWQQLHGVLRRLSVYVKQSGQRGKSGYLTFDPVGTNEAITSELAKLGWGTHISIPRQQSALGTEVDYGISGVLAEGQFSNYPFFLNNVLRAHIFRTKQVVFDHIGLVEVCIVVTKVHALPAANSTLYYEQALKQMQFVVEAGAVAIPTRLVGLAVEAGRPFGAEVSTYRGKGRSREVAERFTVPCELRQGRRGGGRCHIVRV